MAYLSLTSTFLKNKLLMVSDNNQQINGDGCSGQAACKDRVNPDVEERSRAGGKHNKNTRHLYSAWKRAMDDLSALSSGWTRHILISSNKHLVSCPFRTKLPPAVTISLHSSGQGTTTGGVMLQTIQLTLKPTLPPTPALSNQTVVTVSQVKAESGGRSVCLSLTPADMNEHFGLTAR